VILSLGAGPGFHHTQTRVPCPSHVLCERRALSEARPFFRATRQVRGVSNLLLIRGRWGLRRYLAYLAIFSESSWCRVPRSLPAFGKGRVTAKAACQRLSYYAANVRAQT
jgi:hypothetical protein